MVPTRFPRILSTLALCGTLLVSFGISGSTGQGLRVVSGNEHCKTVYGGNCVFEGYGSHGNNEQCTVEVLAAGTLSVSYFDINTCQDGSCECDYLDIDGQKYCGNTTDYGPQGVAVTPGFTFDWVSDHNHTGSGWTVCLSNLLVTSGSSSCQVTKEGNCVTTGSSYGNDEACTVQVLEEGALFSDSFNVESSPECANDALTVNGTRYCGDDGPQGAAVKAGSTFNWESDSNSTGDGWTVCLNSLAVTSGNDHCQLREGGKCIWEGFGDHGNNESCITQVLATGSLSVTFMDIQVCGNGSSCTCDYLEVDGQRYCGKTSAGPKEVAVTSGSRINWHSDNATSEGGFTICLISDRSSDPTESTTSASETTIPSTSTTAPTATTNGATSTSTSFSLWNGWVLSLPLVVCVASLTF